MKRLIAILLCTLWNSTVNAEVKCPSPGNFKTLDFNAVNFAGSEKFMVWQFLSKTFNDNGNQWNILFSFSITTASGTDTSVVEQKARAFFYQQKLLLQSQTQKDNYLICRYVVKDTNTRIIAVSPPIHFIFQGRTGNLLTGPYFPNIYLEDSWADLPDTGIRNKKPIDNIQIKNIQGMWKHNQYSTSIKLSHGKYIFCNEFNNCAEGTYSNGMIYVPAWNVTGYVSINQQDIGWTNGAKWSREKNVRNP